MTAERWHAIADEVEAKGRQRARGVRPRRLGAFALGALALAGCGAHRLPGPTAKPACAEAVVLVDEGAGTPCDVAPPQRLDVRMTPSGDVDGRCSDMGGTLAERPGPDVCEGVDY